MQFRPMYKKGYNLSENIVDARRDYYEAQIEEQQKPGYESSVKVQIMKKHLEDMKSPRIASVDGITIPKKVEE